MFRSDVGAFIRALFSRDKSGTFSYCDNLVPGINFRITSVIRDSGKITIDAKLLDEPELVPRITNGQSTTACVAVR